MYVSQNSDLKHKFEDVTGFCDLVDAVPSEAGRFAAEGLAPLQVPRTDWTQEMVINRAMQTVP